MSIALDHFVSVLDTFASELKRNFALKAAAQPEDQLKAPVKTLLASCGKSLVGGEVDSRTEAQLDFGRPDIAVFVDKLLAGHIELKAPSKGARTERFKGADGKQAKKFAQLPNLMYTDGNEWALYRSGERIGEVVEFEGDVTKSGPKAIGDEAPDELRKLFLNFLMWHPIVPSSPQKLAEELAPLCHLLKEDVLTTIGKKNSNLRQLAKEWRAILFPEADDAQFADSYAQTLTYALLLARLTGKKEITPNAAADAIDKGHQLLAQTLRVLADQQVRKEINLGIELLERTISEVNVELLKKKDEDVWLYFYEHFLAAYDPQLRKDRGAYYTPVQVIRCQCELVEDLLQQRFKKELGFGDKKVVVLDPGAGTGAYPLEAMQKGFRAVEKKYGVGAVGGYASQMAVNINAFEILVGPYAVAHLRLTQQVVSAGGTLPKDGIHVYLTDTLESPYSEPKGVVPLFQKPLAEEHRRAREVKEKVNVLVCIGNPPYDRQVIAPGDKGIERKGGWVRKGDSKHSPKPILEDFLMLARKVDNGVHIKNLYNDYVYFWRWALWKVLEQNNGPGIISFITASSYLVGPGFVGMRKMMRMLFDELWLIDLEGSSLGARKTENVFNIQTPVVIAVGVRYGQAQSDKPATVHYSRITGSRDDKYTRLNAIEGFDALVWQDCPTGWTDVFMPVITTKYNDWPLMTNIFPWQISGVQMKRKWPVAEVPDLLIQRWEALVGLPYEDRAKALFETRDKSIGKTYRDILTMEKLPILANLDASAQPMTPVRFGCRSFDRQWILPDNRVVEFPRPSLWRSLSDSQLFLTSLLTAELGSGPAAMASVEVPDLHFFCNRGAKDVIPLWRDKDAKHANINHGFLKKLQTVYGSAVLPEDLFAYCYSILASPSYTDLFAEELHIPGPRIPFTKDKVTFERARNLGKQMINVHTFGEGMVPEQGTKGSIPTGKAKCVKGIGGDKDKYPNKYEYDETTQSLLVGDGVFRPVSKPVFDYEISGFHPVHSWLGYRMQERTGKSSSPLDEIRPKSWTADLTDELLQVLWTIEKSLEMAPQLSANLDRIIKSPLFTLADVPAPTEEEKKTPDEGESDQALLDLSAST